MRGKLLDISATGCKLRFEGNVEDRLQLGQVYERFKAANPLAWSTPWSSCATCTSKSASTPPSPAVRFHNINGQAQRKIESFVYQLQREARRFDKDDRHTDQLPAHSKRHPKGGVFVCSAVADRRDGRPN
jgi:c-di-GMP-binding flagellar brake protein YcgR